MRAVPEEKKPVLPAQRSELPARPGRQRRADQDPFGIAHGQQRGYGKAQLIQQACRDELPVQAGAALREHAGVSASGQFPERGRQVHVPLPGDDHVGEVGGLLALGAGASATVTTIGGVIAAVKQAESQSSRQERESTATGTSNGP